MSSPETTDRPIIVNFDNPPIPVRELDYVAYLDGWEPGEPIGSGATREAAVAALMEQLDNE